MIPVSDMHIQVRSKNALMNGNIRNMHNLLNSTPQQINNCPNMGPKSVADILRYLANEYELQKVSS